MFKIKITMSDYDESMDGLVEEEESENSYEYDDYSDYSDRECKRCKTEDSYKFVTINPVILTNVPKLMDMASVTIAASLWNHINVPKTVRSVSDRCTRRSTQWSSLCGDVIALISKLPIPKLIAEQIDRYVRKMTNEITAWVSYHYRTVFLRNGLDKFVYSLIYHIVWYPNGAIDCVQTARSMMTSMRLSDVEKFRFLCVYCLYDDMDEMSPLMYLDNTIDYLSCNEDPLIFYWYCYFRNELDQIPGSINEYMLHHDKVDNWPAKEYFFDRLEYDEQAREAIWLIDKHGAVYQKAVFLKLDETQRVHVYIERATQVIVNYARPRISSRFILQTWFEARNLMSKDQFLILFRDLLDTEVKDVLLTEIWASAKDDFKQHAVCANVHEIIRKVLTGWKWRDDYDFIFVLLQDSNAMVKKSISMQEFFNDYCKSLIGNSKLQELDRMLDFCLPDVEDLVQFKINFVYGSESDFFNAQCEKLLINGKFLELDQLLEFCLSDVEVLLNFKTNFINSKHDVISTHCELLLKRGKFQEVGRLLEFCFPYAEDLLQFKMNLVSNSKNTIIKTHCERLLTSSKFQELDQLLEFCLPDADHLAQFKRNFVYSWEPQFFGFDAHCEKLLVDGKFQEFDQLLKFCLPDVEDFLQFKMNFMYNSNHKLINTHCENLLMNRKFEEVDRLLKCCLLDADNLAQFKMNLVKNSKHVGKTCWEFYSSGYLNDLNNYLKQLLSSDAVVQYKKDLITSSHGIDMCIGLMDTKFSILNGILQDVLRNPISITEFKKTMIFSSAAISKLTDLLLNNRLNDVQVCIDRYLISTDDRYALKKRLIGDITKLIQAVLRKNDESYLQTILVWWFGNEKTVQEFKSTLDLDSVFISILKDCVFREYHHHLTKCSFKWCQLTDFNVLDRFLNWYFQSPVKIKEYRMKVIYSYSKIDMFQTLLRGSRGDMQMRMVLEWFFKNDAVQIYKFKQLGGKIANLI